MTENIYFTSIIKKAVIIAPKKQNIHLQETIAQLVKEDFEGKCIEEGYVKPDSTHVTKRSLLKNVPNNFGANMYVDVRFKADICRPIKGNVIECTVEKVNKMGLMAIAGPLSIVIPRNFHNNKDAFKDIDIKSVIQIEVIGARYEINWDHIDVIAKLYDKQKKTSKIPMGDEMKIIETDEPGVDVLETISDNEESKDPVVDEEIEEEETVDDDDIALDDDAGDDGGDLDEDVDADEVGGGDEKEIILDEEVIDDEGNMIGGSEIQSKPELMDSDSEDEEEEDISELTDDDDNNSGNGDDGDYGDDEI